MKKSLANSASILLRHQRTVQKAVVGSTTRTRSSQTASKPRFASNSLANGTAVSAHGIRNSHPPLSHHRSLSSSAVSDRGGAIIPGFSLSIENRDFVPSIHLPPADGPVGLGLYKKAIYCPVSRILRTSAHVGTGDANEKVDGVVGESVTPGEARTHARNSGLRLLATVHEFLDGDLDRVEQVLHLRGLVKSTPDFTGQAGVIDGCSEVLAKAFGPDAGVGTRECFGVGSLGSTVACVLELRVRPKE